MRGGGHWEVWGGLGYLACPWGQTGTLEGKDVLFETQEEDKMIGEHTPK